MGTHYTWLTRIIGTVAIVLCALLPAAATATGPSMNEELLRAAETGSLEQVKSLLAKGADVNAKTRLGITVLMAAVRTGNLDLVKFLVDNGADVNAPGTTKA
ncbi:MAG: ankyrin repeat domain-containing protein [Pseudomonadota bacterium]